MVVYLQYISYLYRSWAIPHCLNLRDSVASPSDDDSAKKYISINQGHIKVSKVARGYLISLAKPDSKHMKCLSLHEPHVQICYHMQN